MVVWVGVVLCGAVLLALCSLSRRPTLPDEGDNHLVELAVAGAADRIVTYNHRVAYREPGGLVGGTGMSTLTIRMADDKHARLRQLAGTPKKGLRALAKLDRHFGTAAGK